MSAPVKNRRFLRFIHNQHQLLQTGFSEYTEAVTTSLIPIDAILPEICACIVGFSCTMWTKMRSLQAHCVLADAILIHPHPPVPPTTINNVRGLRNSFFFSNRKTIHYYMKKGDVGMAKGASPNYFGKSNVIVTLCG